MAARRDFASRVGKTPARHPRRILRALFNDTLVATLAVLALCALVGFGTFALTWLVYRDRYGVNFLDYLGLLGARVF